MSSSHVSLVHRLRRLACRHGIHSNPQWRRPITFGTASAEPEVVLLTLSITLCPMMPLLLSRCASESRLSPWCILRTHARCLSKSRCPSSGERSHFQDIRQRKTFIHVRTWRSSPDRNPGDALPLPLAHQHACRCSCTAPLDFRVLSRNLYKDLPSGALWFSVRQGTASHPTVLSQYPKMFAHGQAVILYFFLSLSILATAMPNNPTVTVTVTAPAATVTTVSQCNTGSIQCCNQVESVRGTSRPVLARHTNADNITRRRAPQPEASYWAYWASYSPT